MAKLADPQRASTKAAARTSGRTQQGCRSVNDTLAKADFSAAKTDLRSDPALEQAPTMQSLPKGKIGALIALLRREEGAGIGEMMAATDWQAHSVRGAMSGSIKKKLGLNVASEKTEAGRRYRIVAPAGVE